MSKDFEKGIGFQEITEWIFIAKEFYRNSLETSKYRDDFLDKMCDESYITPSLKDIIDILQLCIDEANGLDPELFSSICLLFVFTLSRSLASAIVAPLGFELGWLVLQVVVFLLFFDSLFDFWCCSFVW